MPSLMDAIESKYGEDHEAPIGIYVPRIGPRKSIPRLLILNDCDVDSAGDESFLKKTCSGVIEIDLSHNRLDKWSEISKIVQYTPCVQFINLGFNSLSTCFTEEECLRFPLLNRLTVLILISTYASWDSVWHLLQHACCLQELHLSLNDYSSVELNKQSNRCRNTSRRRRNDSSQCFEVGSSSSDDDYYEECGGSTDIFGSHQFPHLRKLMFDGNPIRSWDCVSKLGSRFPNLRHLGLGDCPIQSIPIDAHENFENLQSLTISNTKITDMEDISNIRRFPSLSDLRMQGIPLFADMTAHERRQLIVAMLPNLQKLNGGAPISHIEKEDSERSFIRKFSSKPNQPERYFELVEVHGELEPLMDLKLKPDSKVTVRICYEKFMEECELDVYQTISELKSFLGNLLGISSSQLRIFYVDAEMVEVFGREEMKLPNKQLYSYNIRDGDEIHVDLKVISPCGNSPSKKCAPSP